MRSLQRTVIFGATSAIAHASARRLVAGGASVHCIARNRAKLDSLLQDLRVRAGADGPYIGGECADLDDYSQHAGLLARADAALGGIDAVLVAHGCLPDQQACADSVPLMLAQWTTNGGSAMAILALAANLLQPRGQGVLAAIGSVAGDRGRQSNYMYGTAKGALAIYLQGLRHRLAPHGVAVLTIKPGFVDTPMTDGLDKGGPLWASADTVAAGIVAAMRRGQAQAYLPGFWRYIMLAIRLAPDAVFHRTRL